MSYAYLKPGQARLLVLAMEHDFPGRVEEWKKELAQNRLTTEMRSVFDAMGYDVPRTRHIKKDQPEDLTVDVVKAREDSALDEMHRQDDDRGSLTEADTLRLTHP